MSASPLPYFRSLLARRPAVVALAGLLVVALTPFVFFPEIMGDAGIRHAGVLRNATALVSLCAGAFLFLLGFGTFVWRRRPRRP